MGAGARPLSEEEERGLRDGRGALRLAGGRLAASGERGRDGGAAWAHLAARGAGGGRREHDH